MIVIPDKIIGTLLCIPTGEKQIKLSKCQNDVIQTKNKLYAIEFKFHTLPFRLSIIE